MPLGGRVRRVGTAQVKAAQAKGIQRPFIYSELKKWLPHWAVEKRGGQDGADANKEGAIFCARAVRDAPLFREGCRSCLGRSHTTGGPWPRASRARSIWSQRWRTRTSSCRSRCRRSLSLFSRPRPATARARYGQARGVHKSTALAVIYDELARREWADRASGSSAFNVNRDALQQEQSLYVRAEREYTARGHPNLAERQQKGGCKGAPHAESKGKGKGKSQYAENDKGWGKSWEPKGWSKSWESRGPAKGKGKHDAARGAEQPRTPKRKRED